MTELNDDRYAGRCELCGNTEVCNPCAGIGVATPVMREGEEQRKRAGWYKKRCRGYKK